MTDAQACGDRIGHITMCLHRHHRVPRIRTSRCTQIGIQMIDQLIKRLSADAAGKAVFEDEQRTGMTLGQQTVELVDVLEQGQIRVHSTSSVPTLTPWFL